MRKKRSLSKKIICKTAAALVCCQLLVPCWVQAKMYDNPITGDETIDSSNNGGEYNVDNLIQPGSLVYTFQEDSAIILYANDTPAICLPASGDNLIINPTNSEVGFIVSTQGTFVNTGITLASNASAFGISGLGINSITLGNNTFVHTSAWGGELPSAYVASEANANATASATSAAFIFGDNNEFRAEAYGGTATTTGPAANADTNARSIGIAHNAGISSIGRDSSFFVVSHGGTATSSQGNASANAEASGIVSNHQLNLGDNAGIYVLAQGGTALGASNSYANAEAYGINASSDFNTLTAHGDLYLQVMAQGGNAEGASGSADASAYGIAIDLGAKVVLLGDVDIFVQAQPGTFNGRLGEAQAYALYAPDNGFFQSSIAINQAGGNNVTLTGNIMSGNNNTIDLKLDTPFSYWRPAGVGDVNASFGQGKFDISGGAELDLAWWTLDNYGTYNHTKAKTLTISGESIVGDGATFVFNSDIANNTADKVVFTNVTSATGTQYIRINYDTYLERMGRDGIIWATTPIALLDFGAGFTTNEIVAENNVVDSVFYRFELSPIISYDASGVAYLEALQIGGGNGLSETALTASDAQRALRNLWQLEGNSLMRRMGELRLSNAENGVWARNFGGDLHTKSAYERNFRQKYFGLQIGYDKQLPTNSGQNNTGFFVQNINSSPGYERGSGKAKSTGLGIYSSWLWEKGHYLDVIARMSKLRNKYSLLDLSHNYTDASYHTLAYGLSAEYGYRGQLANKWFYEPQAELALGRINSVSYRTSNDLYVDQSSVKSALARIGILIGREFDGKLAGNYYLKGSLLRDFGCTGSIRANYFNNTESIDAGQRMGTAFELNLGANLQLNQTSSFYFELTKSFAGNVKTDWQLNGGLRVTW